MNRPVSAPAEIVEKVARAMYEYDTTKRGKRRFFEGFRAHYERQANAALDALSPSDLLALALTEEERARVFVDHDNSCPAVAWRSPQGECNCPAGVVVSKLRGSGALHEQGTER